MRVKNWFFLSGIMAAVISYVFGQNESFVPKDLTAQSDAQRVNSLTLTLPFSRSLSLSLFRDFAPPPRRSLQQPKALVGRTVLGGGTQLSLGEFEFRSTMLRSGFVVPRAFPDDPDASDALAVFTSPSPAARFCAPSAFRERGADSSFLLWQGAFHHQSVGYQSRNGRFRATVQDAEADENFQPATTDFSQKLAAETGLQMPLNAFSGIRARQAEAQWKPDGRTTLQAFANTTSGRKGGVVETRAVRMGNAHLKLQWDKVRAEDMNKMPQPTGAAQQQIVNRALTPNEPNRQAPLQIGNWQLWSNLRQEGVQFGYENKGVKTNFERRDLTGTGGGVEQSSVSLVLGNDRLVWQRQKDAVAKDSNPEALKALGLTAFIPRIGWQSSRERLALKFSAKDGFSRELFQLSNGAMDITRISNQSHRTIVGLKLLERKGTQLTLFGGRLQWEEQREQLSGGVDEKFLKAIGWEQVKARLGWSSLWQRLNWQWTSKERLAFSRSRHESGGTAIERKIFDLSLAGGRMTWQRTQDEATPTLTAEQLKALGLSDLASRVGWRETQDRFGWKISPTLLLTHTRSNAEALPDAPQHFRQRQSHETVLTFKPDAKTAAPPMTIAFGGWTLKPKGENQSPVTERHFRWDTAQRLPLFGGLQLTVQRHFTETQQGEKEHDTRYARTVLQTGDKGRTQLFVERITRDETGKERQETLNARMAMRLSPAWRLTSQWNKTPKGDGSEETRQHTLTFQPRPDFAIATQFTRTDQPNAEREQTDLTVRLGDGKKDTQQWHLSRFAVNTPANTDAKGWRFGWNWVVPNRLNLTAQLGQVKREDDRDNGEEKLTLELPGKKQDGLTWRIGYWRLGLLDVPHQQQTAKQLEQAAQAASQPVPQAGTPPATVVNPQADGYRTVWVVASKPDFHFGAQLSQAEGAEKEANDQRVYFELPVTKSRPLALRFGYWKLRQWDGKEREIPVWRVVLPLGKGKLVWGAATYRDQAGELRPLVTLLVGCLATGHDKPHQHASKLGATMAPARLDAPLRRYVPRTSVGVRPTATGTFQVTSSQFDMALEQRFKLCRQLGREGRRAPIPCHPRLAVGIGMGTPPDSPMAL